MAGWGRCRRSKALSLPGGAQARLPTGEQVRGRGSRPPAGTRSTWRGTVAGPSSRPQVPSSSLALCLCGGGRAAGKCGPRENARSSGWQGGLPLTLTPAQGPCGPGLISQGGGTLPGGMLLGWGLLAPARPRLLARNHPAAARTKAISWGPPPCSSIRKGGPLYGWKNRGIFAVMVTGRRGLRVCRHVGQLLAHRPRVSKPHGGRGPLISGCRCRAGVKGWRGHSPGERGHLGPERAPGKIPSPGPLGSRGFPRLQPCGLVLLTWARVHCR